MVGGASGGSARGAGGRGRGRGGRRRAGAGRAGRAQAGARRVGRGGGAGAALAVKQDMIKGEDALHTIGLRQVKNCWHGTETCFCRKMLTEVGSPTRHMLSFPSQASCAPTLMSSYLSLYPYSSSPRPTSTSPSYPVNALVKDQIRPIRTNRLPVRHNRIRRTASTHPLGRSCTSAT